MAGSVVRASNTGELLRERTKGCKEEEEEEERKKKKCRDREWPTLFPMKPTKRGRGTDRACKV